MRRGVKHKIFKYEKKLDSGVKKPESQKWNRFEKFN